MEPIETKRQRIKRILVAFYANNAIGIVNTTNDILREVNRDDSIAFAEWLGEQNYQYSKKHGQWINFPDCYTTKELYTKYILEHGTC